MKGKTYYPRDCQNCGGRFTPLRADQFYCSDTCKADHDRKFGTGKEYHHAEKDQEFTGFCEQCGSPFGFNEYANRGGARAKRFCDASCRAAWHREHKGEQKGTSGGGGAKRSDSKKGTSGGGAKTGGAGDPDGWDKKTRDNWEWFQQEWKRYDEQKKSGRTNAGPQAPKNAKKQTPYEVLGITYATSEKDAQAAYRKLARQFHPDVNKAPEALERMQEINAAWDYVRKGQGWR